LNSYKLIERLISSLIIQYNGPLINVHTATLSNENINIKHTTINKIMPKPTTTGRFPRSWMNNFITL